MGKLPDDATQEEIEAIAFAKTPGDSKKAGQVCRLREDWEEVKIQTMREILEIKFSDPELKQLLLDTDDAELIEGNHWGDKIWGVDSKTGEGENNLDKLLMELRTKLSN